VVTLADEEPEAANATNAEVDASIIDAEAQEE